MGLFHRKADQGTGEATIIDLRERRAQVFPGPGPCPACSGRGFLDHIDLRTRSVDLHCLDCGHAWTVRDGDVSDRTAEN